MMQKSNKVEALATYDLCSEAKTWANVTAEFPQAAHNKVALGMSGKVLGWEHLAQITVNLAGEKKDKDGKVSVVDYAGFMGQAVDFQMGHNWKASDKTDLNCSVKFNKDVEFHMASTHKIDAHWTAKFHNHFFSNRVGSDKAPVDVGMEFSYKL
jgi:hypothetical protein